MEEKSGCEENSKGAVEGEMETDLGDLGFCARHSGVSEEIVGEGLVEVGGEVEGHSGVVDGHELEEGEWGE